LPLVDPQTRIGHKLEPGGGDPLDKLQVVLDNAKASGDNTE
jgi:hypothetical protein